MKSIDLIIPVYNEGENIQKLYETTKAVTDKLPYQFGFLFINDGSKDQTLDQIKTLSGQANDIAFVDLSRNYGKEIAMAAGFDYTHADAVIIMDGDLQHPPAMIPDFVKTWEEGYDDVYGKREDRDYEGWFKRKLTGIFYYFLKKTARISVTEGAGDFRLLDRKVIDTIKQYRERKRYTKGLYNLAGFNKKGIPFKIQKRTAGKTKWSFWGLMNLAISGIVSFTTAPLRFSTVIGFLVAFFSFLYLIFTIIKTLVWGEDVQGYPTMITVILLLGGIQLISLGILGEYIGVIFVETKDRPLYSVNEAFRGKEKE